MFETNSKENISTSSQESRRLPNPSLLAGSIPAPAHCPDITGHYFPVCLGGLWMEMINSTLGKGRTFAPIPSPQPGPQNTLAAPSRVLQSDLSFAEQRSGLSPSLIVSSLSPFAFGTNSSQTGLSSSSPASHYPRETLCTFPRKSSSFSSAQELPQLLCGNRRRHKTLQNHSFPPLSCL